MSLARELAALYAVADIGDGPSPLDTVTTIENHCKGCLDDQLIGLTAQLFTGPHSVPEILQRSLKGGQPDKKFQQSLREQLLRFMEGHIEEHTDNRELPRQQVAEYALAIVQTCYRVFRADVRRAHVPPTCPLRATARSHAATARSHAATAAACRTPARCAS